MKKNQDFQTTVNEYYQNRFDQEQKDLIDLARNWNDSNESATDKERQQAELQLQEQVLSIDHYATYHLDDSQEWHVLLGTGGPADRLVLLTDNSGNIENIDYQYQDWGKPWTSADFQDKDMLTAYASIVGYYGE